MGEAAYTTKLSTTEGVKTYVITPDAETYTFFKMEHDLEFTMYWDSIKIVLAEDEVTPPADDNGGTTTPPTDDNGGTTTPPTDDNGGTTTPPADDDNTDTPSDDNTDKGDDSTSDTTDPDEEEELNFFERLIKAIREFFEKLFGGLFGSSDDEKTEE